MNKEIKAKWIAALRSGDYEQGVSALKRRGKFCCLGVLTDLYIKEKGLEWKPDGYQDSFEDSTAFLCTSVRQWAELDSISPVADGISLAARNDHRESFDRIADVIEAYF